MLAPSLRPPRQSRTATAIAPMPIPTPPKFRSSGAPIKLSPWNQRTYERIKLSLELDLRRQVFIVVCDDLVVRAHVADQLTRDRATVSLAGQVVSPVMAIDLDPEAPHLHGRLTRVFSPQSPNGAPQSQPNGDPVVQVFGVEQLTRQCARLQQQFLEELNQLPHHPLTNAGALMLWIPRPWLHAIRQSAPEFWDWHTGLFEFEGDPRLLEGADPAPAKPAFQPVLHPVQPLSWERKISSPLPPATPAQPVDRSLDHCDHPQPSLALPCPAMVPSSLPNALDAWLILVQSAQAAPNDGRLMARAIEMGTHLLTDYAPTPQEHLRIYETLGKCHRSRALAQGQDQRQGGISPSQQRNIYRDLQEGTHYFRQALDWGDRRLGIPARERYSAQTLELLGARSHLLRLLGDTYQDMIRYGIGAGDGEALDHCRRSMIQAYRGAIASRWCQLRRQAVVPMAETDAQWLVQTYNRLGMVHWAQGNAIAAAVPQDSAINDHFRRAIQAYRRGIARYDADAIRTPAPGDRLVHPVLTPDYHYGTLQTNLGTAYLTLHRGDRNPQWLHAAVVAYHEALPQRDAHQYPAAHAATCNNLGIAYRALARLAQRQDSHAEWTYCQQAIAAYDQALGIQSHIAVTFDRATTAHHLAQLHYHLAEHPLTPTSDLGVQTPSPTPNRHFSAALQAYIHGLHCLPNNGDGQPLLSGLISTAKTILQGNHSMAPQTLLAQLPSQWLPLVLKQL